MRVLGISGSLRSDSHNTRLLHHAAELLPDGATLDVWADLKALPPFDEDDEAFPPAAVLALRQAVADADAVLIATPEYNSSLPGQLKNALDWLSRPVNDSALRNKPVAVVGASPGMFGAVWAQAEARKVLGAIGARVVDRELPLGAVDEVLHPEHGLLDDDLRGSLTELLEELAETVRVREALQAAA